MNIDIKTINKMLNHGKLMENQYPIDFGTPASTGKAANHNITNNMGDNPMVDPSILEDQQITDQQLDKLKYMLNGIGILDSDIAIGNVVLSDGQAIKIVSAVLNQRQAVDQAQNTINNMIDRLSEKLMGPKEVLDEFQDIPVGSRFTYVIDTLGTVNIYDGLDGTAVNLQGSDALEFINELDMMGDDDEAIQELLAQYQHVMEDGSNQDVFDAFKDTLLTMTENLEVMSEQITGFPIGNINLHHLQYQIAAQLSEVAARVTELKDSI